MDNIKYNSLTEQLISDGIIPSDVSGASNSSNNIENTNLFNTNPYQKEIFEEEKETNATKPNKKRLNNYDLELINKSSKEDYKIQKEKTTFFEKILFNCFPKLYKAKLIKEAMAKLVELNIDTNALLDKTIPYGESEIRYKDLIKYLNYANEMQIRLNKKEN